MMQCTRKLKVTDLNPHLICVLCGGYFVDATTIIECLHSFCRSCIVRYLETNKYCPICDVQVHKTRPLQNIRPDDTLQTIVYKLVPGLYQHEMRCRREFYAKHPEACVQTLTPEARGELTDQSKIFLPDEPVSLCLEYIGAPNNQSDQPGTWGRRYLRCPAAVSVCHLHKLIRAKFGLAMGHRVDVFYKDDMLPNNWTLMDIAYIYQWKRKSPIHLSYQILESQRKKIKLSHDSIPSNESSSSAMETTPILGENSSGKSVDKVEVAADRCLAVSKTSTDSLARSNDTKPVDSTLVPLPTPETGLPTDKPTITDSSNNTNVEWKEVQLQISENGIMSVAGVENDRLLTPLQPIGISSENANNENVVKKMSVDSKSDTTDDKQSENKVPPVNSDLNSSALQENKAANVAVKCDSRNKSAETSAKCIYDDRSKSKSENVKDTEAKPIAKDTNNHIDSLKRSNKPAIGYKLPNNSDKTNAIFKSKTDKLEDAVRNIANRNEPSVKIDGASKSPHVLTSTPGKEGGRRKLTNSESVDGLSGSVNRPLPSTPKVYPGLKPPVYNSYPKEEHPKMNNNKLEPVNSVGVKQTPMEILNTQNKLQNHMVKYKSHKQSIKPWNPSISRAAVLAMKHAHPQTQSAATNKDGNSAGENQQLNPPPVKQPRFFKIRNMPRFLGNPASGVKPMYQVAPGSEIVTNNTAAVSATVASTVSSTAITNVSATPSSSIVVSIVNTTTTSTDFNSSVSNCAVTTTVATGSPVATTAPAPNVGVTYTTQKTSKPSSGPLTLMKIDPKTLSPITINPVAISSHVLNNPTRSTPSQPKKLPPPFTPGSPKHSNHYTNCRTAHSNNSSKNTVPRTPSPAHTGGLIPTHPFIPVSHANPHLLYGAFPNPFSPTDPSGNRLLPGPTNSELIRAMSALCSSGSAFHPSLPPSISMLFNPHHAHHRTLQTERSNFKCNSSDKKTTQSPPPTVQRVPPSNPSSKNFNDTETQNISVNSSSSNAELSSNSSRSKKTKTEHLSSPILPTKNAKQLNLPSATGIPTTFSSSTKKTISDTSFPPQSSQHQNDLSPVFNNTISNNTAVENKKSCNSAASNLPKLPGEKIEEITSELSVQNQKVDNKCNKPNSNEEIPTSRTPSDSSTVDSENSDGHKIKQVESKQIESKITNNNNEMKDINETKSKDEQLNSINNNNVNKINKASLVPTEEKSNVDASVVNNKNS